MIVRLGLIVAASLAAFTVKQLNVGNSKSGIFHFIYFFLTCLILSTLTISFIFFGSDHGQERSKEHQEEERIASITDDSHHQRSDVSLAKFNLVSL